MFEVLDILGRLIEKSLVFTDPTSTEARFRLLETVREYARTRLVEAGEAETALRRHRDWYLVLVDRASAAFFQGPEPAEWLARLDREHDDLRAAMGWCLDQPGEGHAGLRIAAGLWRYWEIRGYLAEGRRWLERTMEAVRGERSNLRANALTGAGNLAFMQGDFARRLELPRGEPRPAPSARRPAEHRLRGQQPGQRGPPAGRPCPGPEPVRGDTGDHRELGDRRGMIFGAINLAGVATSEGDVATAHELQDEILVSIRGLGDLWIEAFALDSFGSAASKAGDREAAALLSEALAILEGIGDRRGVARVLTHLGQLALADGDPARARSLFSQSLEIRQGLGDMPGLAGAMENLAGSVAPDAPEAAARLDAAAESLREAIRAKLPPQAAADHDQVMAALAAQLGEERFEAARREGRQMTPNEALATLPL